MTRFTRPTLFLVIAFLGILATPALVQTVSELRRHQSLPVLNVFRQKPTAANLRAYERDLEDASVVVRQSRPWVQFAQFTFLKDAGDKALIGRDGWLFYKPGFRYLTERPVETTGNSSTSNPLAAIVDFRDQLAQRGIRLLVMPAPNKESIYPEKLSGRAGTNVIVGQQTRELLVGLQRVGVEVVDLFEVYGAAKRTQKQTDNAPLYLAQDSHWSPRGVEVASREVAQRLLAADWVSTGAVTYASEPAPVRRLGDVVRMLQVPQIEHTVAPEEIPCRRIFRQNTRQPYADDKNSEILVLGDSFLRIYENDEPGAAGFVAHLAHALKRPLTSIINDGGASTLVRQELNRRPELLANKKVVIWEFVERDIRFGTEGWQRVPLPPLPVLGTKQPLLHDPGQDPAASSHLRVRITWGHTNATKHAWFVKLLGSGVQLGAVSPFQLEETDTLTADTVETQAGAGDVDGVIADVVWQKPAAPLRKPQQIWQYLLEHGTPDQVARLEDDPGLMPDAPILTVLTSPEGTHGFSIGLEQLSRHQAIWLPEHDVFVTLADTPADFATRVASLKGERVLDRVKRAPESTLAEWTNKWADFGDPTRPHHGNETDWLGTKGHLVGTVARHGSLYKFGVDRWANIRPDHASPHKFRVDFLWPGCKWLAQRIENGLPVIVTTLEREGLLCNIEQFAAPLNDTPPAERGEIASVLLTRVRLSGPGSHLNFGCRLAMENTNRHPELRALAGRWCVLDRETGAVWLMIEPDAKLALKPRLTVDDEKNPRLEFDCSGELPPGETRDIVFKLTSPVVPSGAASQLAALDFTKARADTVRYWEDWLARGARFEVPDPAVNALFRANLWHALMLPRFRDRDRIDLPYSNFAYGQLNADWPINQAVYVDYMLYGLRGHFAVAEEELAAMYRSQQKSDGRVGGYAEWGVYSPGMLYAIAQNFLLSGDRASFERLLPQSLKALDWCLQQIARGKDNPDAHGLIVAPLNDLTHTPRAWGFPNAYFVAGLDVFGRALNAYGHPRAAEIQGIANKMRADVTAAFSRASVHSPVVQVADGTWINYVPGDAMTPRRMLEEWYPTHVDCGPLHLARLAAIDPRGWLTTAMLHDHEDNLFLNQWGAANEPVYNQQATAYLYRDEPEAAIRSFYSMIACAFSHHQLTPLEHRWNWGQYYMPPSTDGAWFELYRNLLVNELAGNEALFIGQAMPRAWLSNGQNVHVQNAPTYFGPISFSVHSQIATGQITVTLDTPSRKRPATLLIRLRHPERKPLQSVTVNGGVWSDFDPEKEWIRIVAPTETRYDLVARY